MPRTSEYVEAPYQGVSQAPAQVRLSTQAEEMDGMMVGVPSGATKRPPFKWLAKLTGPTSTAIKSTYISKSFGEFLFTVENVAGTLTPRLYQIDGLPSGPSLAPTALTVSTEAQTYLNANAPDLDDDIVLLTVEDYTFILNRKQVVANGTDSSAARDYEAMVWVRGANYGKTYKAIVTYGATTLTVSMRTPTGEDADDALDTNTDAIAKALYDGTYPISGGENNGLIAPTATFDDLVADGFTVTLQGSIIYISHPTQDFSIEVTDGMAGESLLAIKDKVQDVSDLPKRGPVAGFTVRVSQQTGTPDDDFYMKWVQTAGKGTGIWEETIAPSTPYGVDPETLPVGLVYDSGTGTWSVDVLDWTRRTVGSLELVPDPGFVGTTIQDIVFWRSRIGLLFSEGIRITSAFDPLRIYPSTLTDVLDDDAFEHVNPLTIQAKFRYAVPFKRVLVLWGEQGQAQVHSNGNPLTPRNSICEPYAMYESAPSLRPQGSNDRIYFAAPRGVTSSVIYEIEVQRSSGNDLGEGDDMTVSVPRYLPPSLNRASTCSVNYLTVYGVRGGAVVYPHLYRYSERSRVQNAWSKWSLPEDCLLCDLVFVNTRLYVLVQVPGDGVYLLQADVADGRVEEGLTFPIDLDFKVTDAEFVSQVYDAVAETTTITLPYTLPEVQPYVVVREEGTAQAGTELEVVSYEPTGEVVVEGDWTGVPLMAGIPYGSTYELSRIYYRDPDGRPVRTGKLKLRRITFDLDRALSLQVTVQVDRRPARTYVFGSPQMADDEVVLYSGPWSVPLGGDSEKTTISVSMPSWAGAAVLGYTWEGEINPRARRMGSVGS